jgi:LPXTG-motif cell wall-anchored protein
MKRFFLFVTFFIVLSLSSAPIAHAKIESIDVPTETNLHQDSTDEYLTTGLTFDGKYVLGIQAPSDRRVTSVATGAAIDPFMTYDEQPIVGNITAFRYFTNPSGEPMFMFWATVNNEIVDSSEGSQTGSFLYTRDVNAGTTTLVKDASGDPIYIFENWFNISNDGKKILFDTYAPMDPINDQHVGMNSYLYNFDTQEYSLVGFEATPLSYQTWSFIDKHNFADNLSSDGEFVTYLSLKGTNIELGWYDFANQEVKTIFDLPQGDVHDGDGQEISSTGNKVLFWIGVSLLPEDLNSTYDIYLFNAENGSLELINENPSSSTVFGYPSASALGFSLDGEILYFSAYNSVSYDADAYFYDIATKEYHKAFKTESGSEPNGIDLVMGFDQVGNYYIASLSTNVLAGQTNATGCASPSGVCPTVFTSRINFAAEEHESGDPPATIPDVQNGTDDTVPNPAPTLPNTGSNSATNILFVTLNLFLGSIVVYSFRKKVFL